MKPGQQKEFEGLLPRRLLPPTPEAKLAGSCRRMPKRYAAWVGEFNGNDQTKRLASLNDATPCTEKSQQGPPASVIGGCPNK